MGKEEWRPVIGYEGIYEASSLGRIRRTRKGTGSRRVLKQHQSKKNGYCYVSLSKDNHASTKRVHKLVYEAFTGDICDGYDANRTIDHIDGDKCNNSINNLERVTQSENQLRAVKLGLQKRDGLKVKCLDNGIVYDSATSAARAIGGRQGEMVSRVCRGERSHYRGHHYAFLNDYEKNTIPKYTGKIRKKVSNSLWR